MFKYRIKAEFGFCDGSVFPRRVSRGEILIVDEQTYQKMKQSDPDSITLLDKVVPNPKKATIKAAALEKNQSGGTDAS